MVLASIIRWESAWRALGASIPGEELYHQLVACYSEPHRRYHTIQHLDECLKHLESVRALADHADEVELALWFHDAIYDTTRKDNERHAEKCWKGLQAANGSTVPRHSAPNTKPGRVRISPVP